MSIPWVDWAQAACADHDPELWFPEPKNRDQTRRANTHYATQAALHICLECPIIADCLHHALVTDTRYGIWGGATAPDRAKLTGRRNAG